MGGRIGWRKGAGVRFDGEEEEGGRVRKGGRMGEMGEAARVR